LHALTTARDRVSELGQMAPTLSGSRTKARTNFHARPLSALASVAEGLSLTSIVFTI
jgi:hypothetical protein